MFSRRSFLLSSREAQRAGHGMRLVPTSCRINCPAINVTFPIGGAIIATATYHQARHLAKIGRSEYSVLDGHFQAASEEWFPYLEKKGSTAGLSTDSLYDAVKDLNSSSSGEGGDLAYLRALLATGLDPLQTNRAHDGVEIGESHRGGVTNIVNFCIENNNLQALELMLSESPSPQELAEKAPTHIKLGSGYPPFFVAVLKAKNFAAVELLLKYGAKSDILWRGRTILEEMKSDDENIMIQLLNHPVAGPPLKTSIKAIKNALFAHIGHQSRLPLIKILLSTSVVSSVSDIMQWRDGATEGRTLLHHAVRAKNVEAVEFLLSELRRETGGEGGGSTTADVYNMPDAQNVTVALEMARVGGVEMWAMLKKALLDNSFHTQPNVNAMSKDGGWTMLAMAARDNNLSMVKLLLERGAEVDRRVMFAALASRKAGCKPDEELLRLLLEAHGAGTPTNASIPSGEEKTHDEAGGGGEEATASSSSFSPEGTTTTDSTTKKSSSSSSWFSFGSSQK